MGRGKRNKLKKKRIGTRIRVEAKEGSWKGRQKRRGGKTEVYIVDNIKKDEPITKINKRKGKTGAWASYLTTPGWRRAMK